LDIDPNYTKSIFSKGYMFSRIGEYDKAIQYFDQVLRNDPDDVKTLTKLALSYAMLDKFDDAKYYVQKAINTNQYNSKSLSIKGLIEYRLGNYQNAINIYNKVLELVPDNYKIRTNLAYTYYKIGKYDKAIDLLDEVLKYHPHYTNATNLNDKIMDIQNGRIENISDCDIEPADEDDDEDNIPNESMNEIYFREQAMENLKNGNICHALDMFNKLISHTQYTWRALELLSWYEYVIDQELD
jgi:tetratricopeptide (TPR) repeat protein